MGVAGISKHLKPWERTLERSSGLEVSSEELPILELGTEGRMSVDLLLGMSLLRTRNAH